jgi:hypothetical protein
VPNVFVIGASNFPQNASYNPTDTVGALAYWSADAIVNRTSSSRGCSHEALDAPLPAGALAAAGVLLALLAACERNRHAAGAGRLRLRGRAPGRGTAAASQPASDRNIAPPLVPDQVPAGRPSNRWHRRSNWRAGRRRGRGVRRLPWRERRGQCADRLPAPGRASGKVYLTHQLNSYADGSRKNPVMQPIAAAMNDAAAAGGRGVLRQPGQRAPAAQPAAPGANRHWRAWATTRASCRPARIAMARRASVTPRPIRTWRASMRTTSRRRWPSGKAATATTTPADRCRASPRR